MSQIVVQVTLNDAPVNGLAQAPDISIVRLDTDAVVVNAVDMTDTGSFGFYKFDFTGGVAGVEYAVSIDADPLASGQVDERYYNATFDYEITDLWNDHGLNPTENKTITENTANVDYDEAVAPTDAPNIDKSVVKSGAVTTLDRS